MTKADRDSLIAHLKAAATILDANANALSSYAEERVLTALGAIVAYEEEVPAVVPAAPSKAAA